MHLFDTKIWGLSNSCKKRIGCQLNSEMKLNREGLQLLCLFSFILASSPNACEARRWSRLRVQSAEDSGAQHDHHYLKYLDSYSSSDPYYYGSPSYTDIIPGPSSSPVYCVYPPFIPLPPSTILPAPMISVPPHTPPPPPPPEYTIPSPPTPPVYEPSPPGIVLPTPPAPAVFVPGPVIFQPPIVYPPPSVPPSPKSRAASGLWCVAKPTVPDPIIQEAMNYACGSGADCDTIQPNGLCFQPDTLISHASYAFNSYWQRTKVAGGTCDFGGTAMLITKDPSFDGCHFIIY